MRRRTCDESLLLHTPAFVEAHELLRISIKGARELYILLAHQTRTCLFMVETAGAICILSFPFIYLSYPGIFPLFLDSGIGAKSPGSPRSGGAAGAGSLKDLFFIL